MDGRVRSVALDPPEGSLSTFEAEQLGRSETHLFGEVAPVDAPMPTCLAHHQPGHPGRSYGSLPRGMLDGSSDAWRIQGIVARREKGGLAGTAEVELTENEWTRACNLRERYWLYVVFDCASPRPRLLRVQDPFGKLIVSPRVMCR